MENKHNDKKIVFFENPFLESLTHTHVITLNLVYIPIVIYFLYHSIMHLRLPQIFFCMALGFFMWTLVEYVVHRFIFHYKFENEKLKKYHSIFHLAHHADTHDVSKYQTVLILSIPSGILFYFLFKLIFKTYYEPLFCGFALGYVIYEFTHYSTHSFNMHKSIFKIIKQNHMRHHYFDNRKNFGVTSPLWDHIFNTFLKNVDTTYHKPTT